jgi:hypothetical protein
MLGAARETWCVYFLPVIPCGLGCKLAEAGNIAESTPGTNSRGHPPSPSPLPLPPPPPPHHRHRQSRDGIRGHQFNQRLESFAPCYSQSLLPYSTLVLKILTKKSAKQENWSLFMNSILWNGKMGVGNQTKTRF